MIEDIRQLASLWIEAKEAERVAVNARRELEDRLSEALSIREDAEGTKTISAGDASIKVISRINRSVDGDKLQEIAAENGLSDHLSTLFRWKPEINAAAWKAADESITRPLAGAITAKPGRPSFNITRKEK